MVNHAKLRGLMTEKGLEVGELAKILNLSRQSVSDKINGRRPISLTEAADISDSLNMSMEDRDAIFFAKNVKCDAT
ncbi:MAG: helix-turn-helix transcriptional regulator [Bacteroidales bacterium]|nr:helix-turn-helix transcriptional regulator [Bacteroidales bacterium]